MKRSECTAQPTDLLWDDLVKSCLQFASQKECVTTDDQGHVIRFSTPPRIADYIFDIAVKSK